MRRARFQPTFDRLGSRIVLDSNGLCTGVPLVSTLMAASGTVTLPGDNEGVVPVTGWFLGGTPPSTNYDPMEPPVPLEFQTASSMSTH